MTIDPELHFSLLTEPLIRYRCASDGSTVAASLPQLLVALAADEVSDYPALRPHQRHPWHAFLVQLAAIALHKAERTVAFDTADAWRQALLALTPDDPDGAAWCLVSPSNRPAFMQAPTPSWDATEWDTVLGAPDELDMLATSKNHDLKGARMRSARPEDWMFALISLQTQEGGNSRFYKGISRMNSGYGSRAGVGVVPKGGMGKRWYRDVGVLLRTRRDIVEGFGLAETEGIALVWLKSWDGVSKISFAGLDPFYIEICRRVRFFEKTRCIFALRATTPISRIDADSRKGATGDPWIPIDISDGGAKALTIQGRGFDYRLICDILFSGKYVKSATQTVQALDGDGLVLRVQSVARGQSKTEGYHERSIPIRPKLRSLLLAKHEPSLASIASKRVGEIAGLRWLIERSIAVLFNKGIREKKYAAALVESSKAFAKPFEKTEDLRFFDDLNEEIEAVDPAGQHVRWQLGLVSRAEATLKRSFDAGPRSSMQRYRAQAAALTLFHRELRSDKSPLPELANYYRQQTMKRQEETSDHV
jgi:CRISPR system Cascade subunit CasA